MDISLPTQLPDVSGASADKARQLQRATAAGGVLTEKQLQQAKKVSRDFEGMFVGMMMKSMRSTVGKDKLTGGGHGEEVFRSMLDQEYANISAKKGGGLGIAKMVERDIIRQESRKIAPKIDSRE